MAGRLLDAGYEVAVWNRTAAKAEALAARGARAADTPAAVAGAADIVMLCVTDTAAVEAVALGEAGLEAGADDATTIVDFSSIDPVETRRIAAAIGERCGSSWVDAPVSGGVTGAEHGSLVVMAGGETADIERVRPVIGHLAQRLTHMGRAAPAK